MTSSADSFKNMYKDFLNELMKEYPDIDKIKHEKLDTFKYKGNHMKRFLKRLRTPDDFSSFVNERNEELFTSECKLVKDIGLDIVWPRASQENKDAIWQYLSTMFMLTNAVSAIPPKMLTNIEKMASKIADDMKGSDEIDFGKIMASVQNMMKGGDFENMMSKSAK
jgi:hypothetical protein